jgi:hypothetical protein
VSAPPLPDIFGNYVLGDFVEVVSPDGISWLPQTVGWAWLGVILLALLLRYSWRRLHHWYHNRYRREAIARLQQFANTGDQESWLTELNKLLKITAIAAFSRELVARLSGEEWADFLNGHCTAPPFSPEQQNLLATGAYRKTTLEDNTRQQLLAASLTWVRTHERPEHV